MGVETPTRERQRQYGYPLKPEERALIRKGLQDRGLSIRKAAREAGLHPATLSAILRGHSDPGPETFTKLGQLWLSHRPHKGASQLRRDLQAAS
jgi:transcriptional regulator with XRE-family HTH domain